MTSPERPEDAERARYYLERARSDLDEAAESLGRLRRGYRLALDAKAADLAESVAQMIEELTS